MTCERCDLWLQELFDGAEPDAALIEHLVACPACRELYESAVGLQKGLEEMQRPLPSPEFTGRVVSAVLFDRRKRQKRRQIVARAAALAAAILVVLFAAGQRPPSEREIEPVTAVERQSLRTALTEAGSTVVQNARRQVSEAVSNTLQLVESVEGPVLPPMDAEWPLEPTIRPLREAGQGVTAGLEPVAGTARRAFALFVRDLSPSGKPGS